MTIYRVGRRPTLTSARGLGPRWLRESEDFTGYTRARIGAAADEWLARVPAFLRELTARWDLTLGDPFGGGVTGFTVPAERGGRGDPVVLKLSYPDGWFADETRAIAAFDGRSDRSTMMSRARS